MYITIILPRQARDKHKENSKKDAVFRTEEAFQNLCHQASCSVCRMAACVLLTEAS